jgi:hypothetical protein
MIHALAAAERNTRSAAVRTIRKSCSVNHSGKMQSGVKPC